VPHQSGDLLHLRVFPDVDLVEGVPVGADQLVDRLAEDQVAHLRASVHGTQGLARERVSETDVSVGSAAPRGQKPVLVRRPGHCLHRSDVVGELEHRRARPRVPNHQFIVVSARTQLLLVRRPFQTTDLLLVPRELSDEGRPASHVSMQDGLVPGASGKQGGAPGDRADSVGVPVHDSNSLHLVDVPQVHLSVVGPQTKGRPLRRPPHSCHRVRQPQIAQLGHLGVVAVPKVDV